MSRRLVARVSFENGVLHSGPRRTPSQDTTDHQLVPPRAAIEVDKTADIKAGLAPQNVTYTFRVYNRTVPPYPLENVTVTDNQCPGVTRATPFGDTNGDSRLDPTRSGSTRAR